MGIETTAVDRDPERALLSAGVEQGSLVAGDALVEVRVSQAEHGMLTGESAHVNEMRCTARLTAAGSVEPLAAAASLRSGERLLCLARRPFVARQKARSA